jgi:hypothetical protein
MRFGGFLALLGLLIACASPRPVLYPNPTLERVGTEAAAAEVERCLDLARNAIPSTEAQEIARDTAGNAGAGAAAGAAAGAISGGGAGTGAAVGAASAATFGFVRTLFQRRGPDEVQRRYTERCLGERGYEVIGWR